PRALERDFLVGSPGSSFFASIRGAAACIRSRASCDLSRGIVTDDRKRTLAFHLTAPDPEFLLKLTALGYSAPIPPRVPNHDVGPHPVTGTGPYRILSADDRGVSFVRNNYFHEWSHAAQPE